MLPGAFLDLGAPNAFIAPAQRARPVQPARARRNPEDFPENWVAYVCKHNTCGFQEGQVVWRCDRPGDLDNARYMGNGCYFDNGPNGAEGAFVGEGMEEIELPPIGYIADRRVYIDEYNKLVNEKYGEPEDFF